MNRIINSIRIVDIQPYIRLDDNLTYLLGLDTYVDSFTYTIFNQNEYSYPSNILVDVEDVEAGEIVIGRLHKYKTDNVTVVYSDYASFTDQFNVVYVDTADNAAYQWNGSGYTKVLDYVDPVALAAVEYVVNIGNAIGDLDIIKSGETITNENIVDYFAVLTPFVDNDTLETVDINGTSFTLLSAHNSVGGYISSETNELNKYYNDLLLIRAELDRINVFEDKIDIGDEIYV